MNSKGDVYALIILNNIFLIAPEFPRLWKYFPISLWGLKAVFNQESWAFANGVYRSFL